jgi:serine protease Do
MYLAGLRAALVSMSATLMIALAVPAPASAAGLQDPALADLVATLLPSVVNITSTSYRDLKITPGQSMTSQTAQSAKKRAVGTGFIVTSDGYVVTNKHVVHNGIEYSVSLSDGRTLPADLVAEAPAYDIAVIKIRTDKPLPPVKIGDSDTLRQGDPVIAIGNPLGFTSTVTTGIISAFNRDQGFTEFDNYMQTDAAINQGNSGGPLFNIKGEVIGVNAAIFTTGADTGNVGIGLVIPINDAKFVVQHMREALQGKVARASYIGASIHSITPELAAAYGLANPAGAVIAKIADGSPAAQAKLRLGDVVIFYAGKGIKDSRALMRAIVETPAGTTVPLTIWRDGKMESVPVTPTQLPPDWSLPVFLGEPGASKPDVPPEALANFGLQLAALTPELRTKYKYDAQQQGVVVTGVGIASEAADHGIYAGVVIVKVRDTSVSSPDDVFRSVDNERREKRPVVPMLVADPDGIRWVPFRFRE